MRFNSLQFILFFLAFFLVLFSIPASARKYWLIVASCYFYMVFKPVYLLILISVILVDYFSGIKIESSKKNKKTWLIISLISNIGILVFFKYYNFLNENISFILNCFGTQNPIPVLEIILPIGLSFHTFQAMSYTIEVYRGKQASEKNIFNYALYVLYFPQLVSGPIERPQNLIHQLKNKITFNSENILRGLFRISLGLFKKVVIADRLALFTDPVFNDISNSNGLSVLLAIIFFAFEIYCDFSGYTDIAIGISNMMGISLMENFKSPYTSLSISEFWTRWHISLSTWFRDYVFLPLAYSTSGKLPKYKYFGIRADRIIYLVAIAITFLLCGLWHGASWSFIIWGVLHGTMIIIEKFSLKKNIKNKIPSIIKIIFTFCFVCFAWMFFRIKEINDVFIAFEHLFSFDTYNSLPNVFNTIELIFVFLLIFILLFTEKYIKRSFIKRKSLLILATSCIFLLCYLFGEFYFKQFIYFQF